LLAAGFYLFVKALEYETLNPVRKSAVTTTMSLIYLGGEGGEMQIAMGMSTKAPRRPTRAVALKW
jgi:hypothetical protein